MTDPMTPVVTTRESAVAEGLHRATCAEPWDACCWAMEDPDLTDCHDETGAWRLTCLETAVLAALDTTPQPAALETCDDTHGGEGNDATVYGHNASRRICIRLRDSDLWVYDPRWEDPR